MPKLTFFLKTNRVLVLILAVSVVLRVIGIKPGFHPFHSDENFIYSNAITMIEKNNFKPFRYDYPVLPVYLNIIAYKFFFIPASWAKFYISNLSEGFSSKLKFPLNKEDRQKIWRLEIVGEREVNVLFWGRLVTALMGVGVVFLGFLLGKKLISGLGGLILAALIGFNYRQVLNSHFSLPDIYNAFFYLASFLMALRLRKKATPGMYIVNALFVGMSMSVKYQFFSLLPFFFVHLELTFRQKSLSKRIKFFFRPEALTAPLIAFVTFILLNPYLIIDFPRAYSDLKIVALKNKTGINNLDIYPISYLFHIGIGKISSFLILAGFIIHLLRNKFNWFLLNSLIIPFFITTLYMTNSGFYTRNFVSITPFLLFWAAFLLEKFLIKKKVFFVFGLLLLLGSIWENLANSFIVLKEYTQPWNFQIISAWITDNIPKGVKLAAHSSVPLPDYVYTRIPYDLRDAFFLEEFREKGSDYVVANLDWVTIDFYRWMRQEPKAGLRFWNKPVNLLNQTYPALAMEELSDYYLHSVTNSWQAPDSDFLVFKVPNYQVLAKTKFMTYDFEKDIQGWKKKGVYLWYEDNDLFWEDGSLVIDNVPDSNERQIPVLRWESPFLEVGNWEGIAVRYRLKAILNKSDFPDGFLYLKFFKDKNHAGEEKPLKVRLSSRNSQTKTWLIKEFASPVPEKAEYMVIGFQSREPASSKAYLDFVEIYRAFVKEDLGASEIKPFDLDENNLFPNSHGNL